MKIINFHMILDFLEENIWFLYDCNFYKSLASYVNIKSKVTLRLFIWKEQSMNITGQLNDFIAYYTQCHPVTFRVKGVPAVSWWMLICDLDITSNKKAFQ